MRKYQVGIVQLSSGEDKEENLNRICGYIQEAAENGARLVVLTENMNVIAGASLPASDFAEDESGETYQRISDAAKRLGVYIHGGSWAEKIPGDSRVYNTSFLFSPKGELLAKYRKLHTFDIILPTGKAVRESEEVAAGDSIVTVETELGVFGLAICYDLRFPEVYRLMAERGAQILFNPSNFTLPTGKDHWEPLLRARAIENSCYMIAPNQIGRNARLTTFGSSMVIDPWGTVIARAKEEPGVTMAEIDLDYLNRVRARMQTLENRRTDIYRLEEISHS